MEISILIYLLLGIAAGTISGLIGIGGGVLLTPALVYIFGSSQHSAQGTTLALLVPPIGLLAAWSYYQEGYVNVKVAALICLGFFLGGLLGAKFAVGLSDLILKRIFATGLIVIGLKMIID